MKKLLSLLFSTLSLFVSAQNYPEHNTNSYVNDFANIISADKQKVLDDKIRTFKNKTSVEFTVVTVNSLDNYNIQEYATGLFHKWGVGKKGIDNGLMILIAPNERKWRIEVGYGLEGWITDAYSYNEASSIFPSNFRKGDYFTGINIVLDDFMSKLSNVSEVGIQTYEAQLKKQKEKQTKDIENALIITFLMIVFFVLIVILYIRYSLKNVSKENKNTQKVKKENNTYYPSDSRQIREDETENITTSTIIASSILSNSDDDDYRSGGYDDGGSSSSSNDNSSDFGGGDSGGGGSDGGW